MPGYLKEIFEDSTRLEPYICPHCNFIVKDPRQSICGHRFCATCVDAIFKGGLQVYQCPRWIEDDDSGSCTRITLDQFMPDNAARRDLSGYKVRCDKCGWRGRFADYEGHKMNGKMEKDEGNRLSKLHSKLHDLLREAQRLPQVLRERSEVLERIEEQNKDRERIEALQRKIRAQDRIIALKDVALAEQELRIQALEKVSYNGILVWKITDFAKRRQDAVSGKTLSLYSPCFFTSRHGYKMCARIYLNGDGMGKGNHISLFFVVMKGPYDALLRWPFRQKVTFMVLDQNNREHIIDAFRPDPTSSSFKRPTSDMNIASGCPLFMPISQVDSGHHAHVKDDVMFIKIVVDTSGLA